MESKILLTLVRNKKQYDISQLVQSIKWSGRKGGSARSITVVLLDDSQYDRCGINPANGDCLIFKYDGKELFRGLCMKTVQSSKQTMTVTAYDSGIYLANNRDSFQYKKKTADKIFLDVCNRFGISHGKVAPCSYKIPELIKSKTTAWDVVCDALAEDYKHTKTRHYILCEAGQLKLLKRKENVLLWVIETGGNLISYSYTQSIEDIATRVKIISAKGKTAAKVKESALESKIGVFQQVDKLSEKKSKSAAKKLAETMLKEQKTPKRTINVEVEGIPSVISGMGVYVIIPDLNLKCIFYVDSDTHTFKGESHIMSLSLNRADDFEYD